MTSLRTLSGVAPLLLNESKQAKAGVFRPRHGGTVLLLPYFRRKPAALHRLLGRVLPALNPELFFERRREWGDEDAYQLPGVLGARAERQRAEEDHERLLARLDAEEAVERLQQAPFVALLRATGAELAKAVHYVLEWLGFDVVDGDAGRAASGGPLEEDLQIKDGEWFALVEVTGSRGNAREKDFMDLEKYRYRRTRDPGRDDVDPADVRGVLVVNQHHRDPPARREPPYASSGSDWSAHAADTGITIVPTWELFKLVRAVMAGDVDKPAARRLIQQPGLFSASADATESLPTG